MRVQANPLLPAGPRHTARLLFYRALFVFTLLFIISSPFPYYLLPHTGNWLQGLFESLARFTGRYLFGLQPGFGSQLVSDSSGFYLHVFNVLVLALLVAGAWAALLQQARSYRQLRYGLQVLLRYYLALHLLIYGVSKICKLQFYLPEPNILYTPLGQLHADIAYWSVTGISRSYSIFLGVAEVVAAALLLFRKTLLAGALLAAGILLHVFVLNLAYDISVKIHSGTLLLFALLLLLPYAVQIGRYLAFGAATPLAYWRPVLPPAGEWLYRIAKCLVIGVCLAEALYPAWRSGQWDDDKAPRPFLHGAWQVESFVADGDTLPPLLTDSLRWKRVFIHRQHYFITQLMNDEMVDYELEYDTAGRRLYVAHYTDSLQRPLHYTLAGDSVLLLEGGLNGHYIEARLRLLPPARLPLLQKEFNWTVEP